jgi:general nucleoside transport system permease protein
LSALRIARMLALIALVGLILTSLLVALLQGPGEMLPAIGSFARGVGGSTTAIGTTGEKLTPILLIGVAASIAFRAGLFDVGQVGQYLFGGLLAGAVAPVIPGPGIVIIALSLLVGAAAGALWATFVYRVVRVTGLQLVVLSLVANYMAASLAALMTRTLFQDPTAYDVAATRPVPQKAWLPLLLPQTALTIGLLVALAALATAWLVISRTAIGHRVTMFGRNPLAASLAGVDSPRFEGRVLAVAGAVCGLAGAIEVLGVFHGYQDGTLGGSNSIAWTGLTAAILVPSGVLALLPVSLLLAALNTGFQGIQQSLGLSSGLSTLLAGVVIITAAFAIRNPASRATTRHRPRRADGEDKTAVTGRRSSVAAALRREPDG